MVTNFQTIKCDNPDCNKEIHFDVTQAQNVKNIAPWILGLRTVVTLDKRELVYCSDVCEINGAKSGLHNPPAPKQIIEEANAGTIAQAAAAADAARASDENLKRGSGGPVIVRG